MNRKTGAADGDRAPVVVWLHGDHLSPDNPALTRYPDAPVVFVFDEDFLQERRFAFHRLFFLYESVTEIFLSRNAPTSLRRGNVVAEVRNFAERFGAECIITTATPGDRFAAYCAALETTHRVQTLPVPLLVPYDAARVPNRFSAWWREVEEDVLRP